MIHIPELERLGLAVAAMSDRSDGDCRNHDPAGDAGRQAFCESLGIRADDLVCARQVHGVTVARATSSDRGRGILPDTSAFPETDAIVTDVAGLPLGVTVADCVPVWLFDPVTRSAGIVHAGRVGTYRNIVRAAIDELRSAYGVKPEDVYAGIGPSAGPDSYEVSEEIAQEFAAAGLPTRGRRLDLWEANVQQLEQIGLLRKNIYVSGICTIRDGRFHSHRAHRNGMRNLAAIVL